MSATDPYTDDHIPTGLDFNPPIFLGLAGSELIVSGVFGFVFFLVIGLILFVFVIDFPVGSMITGLFGMMLTVFATGKIIAPLRRNKPRNYITHKLRCSLATKGIAGIVIPWNGVILKSQRWQTGRTWRAKK